MTRKRFIMAPDAAAREVRCGNYRFNGGAPQCTALTHPWCLAPGESPLSCKFRVPEAEEPEAEEPEAPKKGKRDG